MQSVDPSSGKVLREHSLHSPGETQSRLAQIQSEQQRWRRLDLQDRAEALRQVSAGLRERSEELAQLMVSEMGKPLQEALSELLKCASVCEFYAEQGPAWLSPTPAPLAGARRQIRYLPLGVVLAIMPWNFPFWQAFRCAAPAWIAGNGVLLKHAPNVQGCAEAIEELSRAAGLPLLNLRVEVEDLPGIMDHEAIAAVTLTGSERAGSAVAALAGERIKKSILELGGSDPALVLADADLDHTVRGLIQGRHINSGQTCCAIKRVIVVEERAEELEERLLAAVESLRWGPPLDPQTQIGPMARSDLRDQLHQQVLESVRQGAELRCGGRPPAGSGWYYPPTLLTGVRPGMPAFDEELFGPVTAVVRVRDQEEAVALANATRYGLAASIWTSDLEAAWELADQLEAGGVFINRIPASDPAVPFGGIKRSGFGRELGRAGLLELTQIRTVWGVSPQS